LKPKVLGLDLAGVEKRPTGVCLLYENLEAEIFTLYSDREILEIAGKFQPKLVAVDAPLNLPRKGFLRPCDRELISRGIRVLPPKLGGMETLTLRASKLKRKLEARGFKVIECFPGAVRKMFSLPPKRRLPETLEALEKLGLKPRSRSRITVHEVDSILAALTGFLHLRGLTETVGTPQAGQIVIPKPEALEKLTRNL